MKLLVRHQTVYRYAASAGRVAMRLKLMPVDTPAQTVLEWQVSVNGEPITGFHPNSYGEREAIWIRHDRLDHATIVAEGLVDTRESHGVVGHLSSRVDTRYFLRDTSLTRASAGIAAMARDLPEQDGPLATLHALSAAVSDAVQYRAGVTTSNTTAAQAFALGAGVCQDHAQVFIAAARSIGIPARYVSGYLLAGDGDALHETHGWAEAYLPQLGWIGFDPSNRVCVTERYLRVASGLDADEAAPIRGSVTVAGDIWIDADVRIAQAEDGVEQRQLQKQQQQATPPDSEA
ncbi:transglutaminase family protein [Sphingobium limneticum]|uniref:Transglutaminase family protein n=1 Tax=Sphingobium limneticum TaxID=1007511 RepID=A0A5J5I9Y7_9SPHN|nr:transglutaminase family protein [Sphingobium limneticum]KAA9020718.1 transglutaminase family protein [Sphingobium limneticum]KAA9033044.1 transglutaminase family protein [Sphingobium limneticum]